MNTRFPTALVGTTQTTSGSFVFDAPPVSFGAHPNTGLINGKTYPFFVRWPDNTTEGFLEGFGVYSSAGNGSITRAVIVKSTAGVGVDYVFAAGTKHLAITTAGSQLASLASAVIDLEPHLDIRFGSLGASNNAGSYYENEANAVNVIDTKLKHYASAGTLEVGRPLTWQVVDPNFQTPATEHWDGGTPMCLTSTGGRKAYDTGISGWRFVTSPAYSFAREAIAFTGRGARVITQYYGGVGMSAFKYNTGSVITSFVSAVQAGMAALPAEQKVGGVEKLHFVILVLENDINDSTSTPGRLAFELKTMWDRMGDAYNIVDENSTFIIMSPSDYLTEISAMSGAGRAEFNGLELAAHQIGQQAIYLPHASRVSLKDEVHYWGEAVDKWAALAAKAVFHPVVTPKQATPVWSYKRAIRQLTSNTKWTLQADGAGAVTAGQLKFNVGRTSVSIAKTGAGAAPEDFWSLGMRNLSYGDKFTLEVTEASPMTNGLTVTLTGPSVESTDYGTWPCTVAQTGTPPNATEVVIMNTRWGFENELGGSAVTSMSITLSALATGKETKQESNNPQAALRQMYLDGFGKTLRSQAFPPIAANAITNLGSTGAAETKEITWGFQMGFPGLAFFEVLVGYKVHATNVGGMFRGRAIIVGPGIFQAATIKHQIWETIHDEANLATDPAFIGRVAIVPTWGLNVTGVANSEIRWTCHGTIMVANAAALPI